MAWYRPLLRELAAGRDVRFRARGTSMRGRVESEQFVTVSPVALESIQPNDIVFVREEGNYLLRLVKWRVEDGLVVGPTQEPVERHVLEEGVLGKVVRVETPAVLLPELRVDGNSISPHAIWIHYQREPHPGGHRYHWRIPIPLVGSRVSDFAAFETNLAPDEDTASNWLYWLGSILAHWSRLVANEHGNESPEGCQFVLKSIAELAVGESDLIVSGVCSPFIRFGSQTK